MKIKMLKPSKAEGLERNKEYDLDNNLAESLVKKGAALNLEKTEPPLNKKRQVGFVLKKAVEDLEETEPEETEAVVKKAVEDLEDVEKTKKKGSKK